MAVGSFFLLLTLILLLGLVLGRWFVGADPTTIARLRRVLVMFVGGGLLAFLTITGRLPGVLIALSALLPLLVRWRALWQRLRAVSGPTPGSASEIKTRFLRMSLNHDTGVMSGVVLEGHFSGRRLGELNLEELLELLGECRVVDEESAAILEAYLDRVHGQDWREQIGDTKKDAYSRRGAAAGPITREEAYAILGLEPGASQEEIKNAHRRLMQKLHPDRGGSSYLAAKINQAKDLLLRG
jgi:DnaJ-class molecular chaperone with C-terminal Zn finger domain